MNTDEIKFIDSCFTVDHQQWGTWQSYDREGRKLITSLTEESCLNATRWYLKSRQESFTGSSVSYDDSVNGEL